jgi:hypothetical protein
MSEAKQSQSRIFFEKKDEAFINKENLKTKNLIAYVAIDSRRSDSTLFSKKKMKRLSTRKI